MAEGGCHCGAVRYAVTGEALRASLCHCADCRRHAGAPMMAWGMFEAGQVLVLAGAPATYASSETGRRQFCPACGTGLFYANAEILPGLIDVQLATLDDPDAFAPLEHVQVAERIGWMEEAHALPVHERYPPDL